MKNQPCCQVGATLVPSHLQSVDHQATPHLGLHRPAHHAPAKQIDDHSQEQPALIGRDVGDVTGPRLVWRGHGEVAVQNVWRYGQIMPAIGRCDAKAPLPAGLNAMLLHEPLHTLLTHANAACQQLPPDARPAVGSPIFCVDSANLRQQRLVGQMAALGNLLTPRHVLMKAGHTHSQHPALHANRPLKSMTFDEGILHFWPLAKYAVAFPKMSRSIVTRASSARKRLISICSAVTPALPLTSFNVPARWALIQLNSVCSTTPRSRAAAAMLWPDSTSRTASFLNSSVYLPRCPFLIFVSLSLLKQLAKGYVLQGQGQVAHVRLVIVKNHGAGAHPQYFQPRTTVWGQLWGQLNTNHMNIYIVINSLQLLFGSRRAYQLKGREERSGIFADIQRATDFEVD